ncbi:uncharacterized protein JN550_005668 [Neoarthrinium moseri]|uniref:uncharacterized protein n=1 Tax=Neoarthrinium moseri TaxID=1658444 RepID=UPI001FDAFD6F|nr:uncharacterized protein JN550_005668 [Neoarthrinium moseri]KAI1869687.1 hypothetical protein JN550_005668 [Neoarthrinium moseri]
MDECINGESQLTVVFMEETHGNIKISCRSCAYQRPGNAQVLVSFLINATPPWQAPNGTAYEPLANNVIVSELSNGTLTRSQGYRAVESYTTMTARDGTQSSSTFPATRSARDQLLAFVPTNGQAVSPDCRDWPSWSSMDPALDRLPADAPPAVDADLHASHWWEFGSIGSSSSADYVIRLAVRFKKAPEVRDDVAKSQGFVIFIFLGSTNMRTAILVLTLAPRHLLVSD